MSIYSALTLMLFFLILFNINLHIWYKKIIFIWSLFFIYLIFAYESNIYAFLNMDANNIKNFDVDWHSGWLLLLMKYYFVSWFLEEWIKVILWLWSLYLILKLSKEKNIKQKVLPILVTTFFVSILSFVTIENILYIENQNVYRLWNHSFLEWTFITNISSSDKELISTYHSESGDSDWLLEMFIMRSILSAIQHFTYTSIIVLWILFFIKKRIKLIWLWLFWLLWVLLHAFSNLIITLWFAWLYLVWFLVSIFILFYISEIYIHYTKKEDYKI